VASAYVRIRATAASSLTFAQTLKRKTVTGSGCLPTAWACHAAEPIADLLLASRHPLRAALQHAARALAPCAGRVTRQRQHLVQRTRPTTR
jgi:hypothetical protein